MVAYVSENLKITAVSENSFIHTSYLVIPGYGTFPSNGLVYLNNHEAVIFDTPIDSKTSLELVKWVVEVKKCDVTAIIINHFHDDCLGGLDAFHTLGIPSFSHTETILLAVKEGTIVPQIGFKDSMELDVGHGKVINRFFGAAHTTDNIVSYIPDEELLFGGCMIKSINAKKGNLADADVTEWSHTVSKIKATYPELRIVVPGHGDPGGNELLDYTMALFSVNKN